MTTDFNVLGGPEGETPPELQLAKAQLNEILENLKATKGDIYAEHVQLVANGKMMADVAADFTANVAEAGAPMQVVLGFMRVIEVQISIYGTSLAAYRRVAGIPCGDGPQDVAYQEEVWQHALRINAIAKIQLGDGSAQKKLDTLLANIKADAGSGNA